MGSQGRMWAGIAQIFSGARAGTSFSSLRMGLSGSSLVLPTHVHLQHRGSAHMPHPPTSLLHVSPAPCPRGKPGLSLAPTSPPAWPIMQSSRYRAWPAAPPKQASSLGPLRLCTGPLRGLGSRAYLLLTEPMPKLTFRTQVPPDLQPSSMSPQAALVSWVHLFCAPNSSLV